jgi:hypothetical protein
MRNTMAVPLQFPLSGPEATKALNLTRDLEANKTAWPYVHVFPPPNSKPVHQIGSVVCPAQGATAVVLAYQVPSGFRFIMDAILQAFTGGAFVPRDALWTVDLNNPVIAPVSLQGAVVQGLTRVPVPLGSWVYGTQWRFPRAYEFEPLSLLQSKVTNVNLVAGLPNWFVSGFFGYLIPALKG